MPRRAQVWSETWLAPEAWLEEVEARLRSAGTVSARGGDFDRWDLAIRGGILGGARLLMAIEEHGAGQQLVRFRMSPRLPVAVLAVVGIAAVIGAWPAPRSRAARSARPCDIASQPNPARS